jgi:hypothetical protein
MQFKCMGAIKKNRRQMQAGMGLDRDGDNRIMLNLFGSNDSRHIISLKSTGSL